MGVLSLLCSAESERNEVKGNFRVSVSEGVGRGAIKRGYF